MNPHTVTSLKRTVVAALAVCAAASAMAGEVEVLDRKSVV